MEFAFVLVNYGVKVTIIEFLDRALPNEDADVSKEIAKQYKNYGVDILTSTKVETVVDNGSSVTVTYTGKDGQSGSIALGSSARVIACGRWTTSRTRASHSGDAS